MNTLYLYANEISVGDLKQFLDKIGLGFNYIILEFYDRVVFEKFALNLVADEDTLNRGRVFSNEHEIKWRKKGNKFVVVLMAEKVLNGKVAPEFKDGPLEVTYAKRCEPEDGLLLWGEYLDQVEIEGNPRHRWFEKRIPQPQFYPVNAPHLYVRLKTTDYYNNQGQLIARRLTEPYSWEPKRGEE